MQSTLRASIVSLGIFTLHFTYKVCLSGVENGHLPPKRTRQPAIPRKT